MWNFWGSTFWFIDSSFLLCPHMVEAGKDLCGISLVRMLIQEISFMMSPPSWPTHRPEDYILISYHCCSSVTKLCPALCDPMDCSMPGLPVLHYPQSLLKLMSIESVMLSNHFILCHPILLLPSLFPSIRVFSSESALCIRWSKYWSFSIRAGNGSSQFSWWLPDKNAVLLYTFYFPQEKPQVWIFMWYFPIFYMLAADPHYSPTL